MAASESILLELESQEEARFWAKVRKLRPNQCWPWTRALTWGYGSWRVRKILYRAHRVAWVLTNRQQIPDGLDIRHSCHVTGCCNPEHLVPGTRKQNMQDSVRAGRTKGIRVGSNNGFAKLDEARVRKIKQMLKAGKRQADIAAVIGISRPTISLINTGRIWSHVII